jgi:hypothetical protein
MKSPIRRTFNQPDLIGIPPRPTVQTTPRGLSGADRAGLIILAIIAIACIAVTAFTPRPAEAATLPQWRLPGIQRPADLDEVTGLYPIITSKGARLERIDVFFMAHYEEVDGKTVYVEWWLRDEAERGMGLNLKRPLYWTTRDEAKKLDNPEIPDILLWQKAKERMR